jgi:hypothetical protein
MSWVAIGVGVVGAGVSAYGASQADGGSAPMQLTPKQSLLSYIKGLEGGLPKLTSLEQSYRPQYGQLNIADQTQYLNALLGLAPGAQNAAGQQLQQARQQDYANMRGNTGSVLDILRGIDPAGQQQAATATTLANDAFNRAQGPLSFQEKRGTDQAVRESYAARGRLNDNASIFDEMMGRESVMAAKRAEASQLGQTAFGLNQQFTSPVMALLQGIPANVAMGQDYLNASAGAIGQNTPQMINPDAGINMGMQQNANLAAYQNAQAAKSAGQANMWGSIGSSLLGMAGDIYKNR